jgi:MFS family permease
MEDYSRAAKGITATLFATQSLGRAAFITIGIVSAIVGAELSSPVWAGVPSALLSVGAAFGALAVGAATDRIGRRWGFALGLVVGVLGAGLAAGAVAASALALCLVGFVLMGVASAAIQLGRFAAAEVHAPESRGRAISNVVIGGTVGAVLGPLLVAPSGRWALQAGMNELAGPFLAALVILALAAVATIAGLRPDPRDLGREIAKRYPETVAHHGPTRSISRILRSPPAFVAVSAMVFGQVVMVMLMAMTSLHMVNNQHALADISVVISAHALGMFAFSFFSGRLTDRWGRGPVILSGAGILVLASLLAPLSAGVVPLSIALFLLGLGWNLCYVAGSTLLSDQLSPAERAKTQGTNDMLIGLATAAASLGSGLLFAATGYIGIAVLSGVASLVLLTLTGWWMATGRRHAVTCPQSPCPESVVLGA